MQDRITIRCYGMFTIDGVPEVRYSLQKHEKPSDGRRTSTATKILVPRRTEILYHELKRLGYMLTSLEQLVDEQNGFRGGAQMVFIKDGARLDEKQRQLAKTILRRGWKHVRVWSKPDRVYIMLGGRMKCGKLLRLRPAEFLDGAMPTLDCPSANDTTP